MKTSKVLVVTLIAAIFGGLISAITVVKFNEKQNSSNKIQINSPVTESKTQYANFTSKGEPLDFSEAAEKTVPAVVHVKVSFRSQTHQPDIFEYFFGTPRNRQEYTPRGSGSGVIISADGYIVTNNHVIDNATDIKITLDDKTTLDARLIGADKNTDIALLKVERIDGKDFPYLTFSDSDNLRLGQWVLAVGNPFNLTSTVTAGIISAKARDLNISRNSFRIESFIQTDAVVNPGNSGGALVNLKGELVGINTAIASRSGQYEGYSFAVPTNIAKKIVEDLMQYGVVQRAMLGISYFDLNDEDAEERAKQEKISNYNELKKYKGVYIADIVVNSAADEAGLKKGDVLTNINGKEITSTSIVAEEVGKLRPGDKAELVIIRNGKMKQISATLRNTAGNTGLVSAKDNLIELLGADFKPVDQSLANKLGISGGIQVTNISNGKLMSQGIKDGYIILSINQKPVSSKEDLIKVLRNVKKGVFLEGIYPNGQEAYYAFGI